MPGDVAAQITAQDHDELRPIVAQILSDEATPIGEVTATKIGLSAGQATAGIFHVTGRATTPVGETEWSAVVKVLGIPELSGHGSEYDAYRELEIYRSGAFAEICGGVRAARCYAIQQINDLHFLWLEDLSDAPQPPWQFSQFLDTARHLGQFNAHWPEHALPQWDWLSQPNFQAEFTGNSHFQAVFERFPTQQDHPLMRSFAPPTAAQALMQLWEQCDELLVQAEGTTKGICHLDCHPKNLFPMHQGGGDSYTIGIDWVKVGIANLGIDIGHLLASTLKWLEITPDEARALRDPIFDAYVSGLANVGWSGNEDATRLTYLMRLCCEAIRETNLVSRAIESAEWAKVMERFLGQSMTKISARFGANLEFYLDCKDEAIQLAKRL